MQRKRTVRTSLERHAERAEPVPANIPRRRLPPVETSASRSHTRCRKFPGVDAGRSADSWGSGSVVCFSQLRRRIRKGRCRRSRRSPRRRPKTLDLGRWFGVSSTLRAREYEVDVGRALMIWSLKNSFLAVICVYKIYFLFIIICHAIPTRRPRLARRTRSLPPFRMRSGISSRGL